MRFILLVCLIAANVVVQPRDKQQAMHAVAVQRGAQGKVNPLDAMPYAKAAGNEKSSDSKDTANTKVWDWPDSIAPQTWSNWFLGIVGIGGIIAALITLSTIKRQTRHIAMQAANMTRQTVLLRQSADAARDNAEAAKENAKALIASERAWIHGDFVKRTIISGVDRYSLVITNQGKTPAQVSGYDIWHGLLTEGVQFSKEKLTAHFTEPKQVFIGGGQTETLRDDFNVDDLFVLQSGETAVSKGIPKGAFCVTIKYFDVVNVGDQRKEHHTSFVYFCDLLFPKLDRISQYNEYS